MNGREDSQEIGLWKGSLLKLPDEVFFDIMRNYLGELKTPFNKHSLVEELSSFLRKPSTLERIVARIDETDARVLTAIEVLGRPTMERLFGFFEDAMSYLELHYLLLNLQERLLVYLDGEGRRPVLVLNPVLAERLREEILDTTLLFPSADRSEPKGELPWPTESLLLAFFSYLCAAPDLLKTDGRLKKRPAEEIDALFPHLADGSERGGRGRALRVLYALGRMGLVRNAEGVFEPRYSRWQSFAALDSASRRALFWSALLHTRGHGDLRLESPGAAERGPGPALENEARRLASFLANLEPTRSYTSLSLERILKVAGGEHDEGQENARNFVTSLVELGLLVALPPPDGKEGEWFGVNPHIGLEGQPESRPVIVEPNFQLTMKPSVDFGDGLLVASMAEIRQFDFYPRYEVTKRSFLRALEREQSSESLIELLERLGESRLPQNIRFSLESWEKEFRGVALYRGVVLTADNERRHLIEHSEAMKPWLIATLAPGIYLLDQEQVSEWSRALKRSGIDPLPLIRTAGTSGERDFARYHPLGEPRRLAAASLPPRRNGRLAGAAKGEELSQRLHERLESLELSPEVASDLAARINKKLILFSDQLGRSQPKIEKSEAKGVDYIGKVRLVEQALKSGTDLLEILERTANGNSRRLLVRPVEVRKGGSDLILRAVTLPENETVHIVVRKIGLVRKLKSSLYAP